MDCRILSASGSRLLASNTWPIARMAIKMIPDTQICLQTDCIFHLIFSIKTSVMVNLSVAVRCGPYLSMDIIVSQRQ
jgi:hypothetical protein